MRELGEHDAGGAVRTMLGVQRQRPSLYALEAELREIEAPVLILAGDEDDGCLETSLWLKRVVPRSGLAVLPKSGHTLNLEEPDLVNALIADFLGRVAAGAWGPPRPTRHARSHHRHVVARRASPAARLTAQPTLQESAPLHGAHARPSGPALRRRRGG